MKKLTSLEDTATITITGRDAVRLLTLERKTNRVSGDFLLCRTLKSLLELPNDFTNNQLDFINYSKIQREQEALAFPQQSKKDLMLKELQSKMDALQCEIDKIKGESF